MVATTPGSRLVSRPARRDLERAPSPELDDLTRRQLIGGATALLLATAAGCGATERASAPSSSDPATRSFTHDAGTAEIPPDPQRVVVIYDGPRLDVALACGVPVVGGGHAPHFASGFAPWHDPAAVADIADVGWQEFNVEAVAALRPDLIVSQPNVEVSDLLADIAPIVVLDLTGNWWSSTDDWKGAHRRLGDLYRCGDHVDSELVGIDQRVGDLRGRLGDPSGLLVSVVRLSAGSGPSQYSNRLHTALLGELGVDQPPAQRLVGGAGFSELSLERLAEVDGDVLVVFGTDELLSGDAGENQRYFDEVEANPLWTNLAAVKAGQVHVVRSAAWNATGGFEAAHRLLDDLDAVLPGANRSAHG